MIPFTEESTLDPVIETARSVRDHLEAAHQRQRRITTLREKMIAIDAETVDEELTGYLEEYRRKGQRATWPKEGARPEMEPALINRLIRHGIDLDQGDDGSRGSTNVR